MPIPWQVNSWNIFCELKTVAMCCVMGTTFNLLYDSVLWFLQERAIACSPETVSLFKEHFWRGVSCKTSVSCITLYKEMLCIFAPRSVFCGTGSLPKHLHTLHKCHREHTREIENSATWELFRMQNPKYPSDSLSENLHFNKIPSNYMHTKALKALYGGMICSSTFLRCSRNHYFTG